MIELDEANESVVGHGVFWRKAVLLLIFIFACMNSAWGVVRFALDVRQLLEIGPGFFMTLVSVGAALITAWNLPYSDRIESGAWKADLLVLALFAALCRLLLKFDVSDLGLVWMLAGMAVYVGFLFLYPFAHRLDTGRWRSDMLVVLGVFGGLALMIYLVWIR